MRRSPRDYPADKIRADQYLPRSFAHFVKLFQGNHILVGGDLEYAVRRGVNDGLAALHVLIAQFLDDDRAGSDGIAQRASADALFEFINDARREALGVGFERLLHDDTGHLPMAAGGILGVSFFGCAAIRAPQRAIVNGKALRSLDAGETHSIHIGQI